MCRDALDALAWVESIGGLSSAIKRSENNLEAVKHWVKIVIGLIFYARI